MSILKNGFYESSIYGLRKSTSQSYEMIICRHIKPYLRSIPLASLTGDDIQEILIEVP